MGDGRRWAAVLLALLLVACSGSDDGSDAGSTTTTTAFGPDRGDGTLTLGTDGLAPAERAGAALARQDVRRVLGQPLTLADRGDVALGPGGPFTTVAPAAVQAEAVAEVAAGDGVRSVAVLADDGRLTAALERQGLTVTDVADEPEGVVLGAADAAERIDELVDDGYSPADHRFYVVADHADPALGFAIGGRPGLLEGVQVVQPGAEVDEDLRIRLYEVDRTLGDDLTGAPEAYDIVVIAALAAESAGSDDPDRVAAEVAGVTQGGDTCTSFQDCRLLLADGVDIAYAGLGGSYGLDASGEPTQSVFTVSEYGADNLLDPNRTEYVVATSP